MGMFGTKINLFPSSCCDDSATLKSVKVHVSNADMATLFATPIQVIPAPGVGRFIEIISMSFFYDYVTLAYDAVTLNLTTDTATSKWVQTGTIDATSDKYSIAVPTTPSISIPLIGNYWIENKSVYLKASAATGSGNGTFDFYILYRIITL